jgi:type II secretory pathway pseudopilin PulG
MLNWKTGHHRRGEALIETVIAMGVLAIGITISGEVMGTSLRNVNTSKNRVVAVSIAKEGLEAIRNIRDTNWLRYSGKKRECWNHEPTSDKVDPCPDSMENGNLIQTGRYIVYKQPLTNDDGSDAGWKWRLEAITDNPLGAAPSNPSPDDRPVYYDTTDKKAYAWDGKGWNDLSLLYLVDISDKVDSDGDHNYTNDPDTYNHALVEEKDALGKDYAVKSPFRREVDISYLDDNGRSKDPTAHRMDIRCKVSWQDGKNEFSTELATRLTDYLGRTTLN